MTVPTVPRWAERLLEASGADAEFRDAVIGDLAEEFYIRARYDGERGARRWYAREMLRTLPHLLRSGLQRGRRPSWKSLIKTTVISYISVVPFATVAAALLVGSLETLHLELGASMFPHAGRLIRDVGLSGLLVFCIACSLFGGAVAARRERRAPLVGSFALGCFMSTLSIVGWVAGALSGGPVQPPLWWVVAQPAMLLVGTAAGGALQTVRSKTVRQ